MNLVSTAAIGVIFFPLVLASTPLLSCKIQYPFLAASTLCTYGESHGWTSLVTWLDE